VNAFLFAPFFEVVLTDIDVVVLDIKAGLKFFKLEIEK
jgi:hypothetical protein